MYNVLEAMEKRYEDIGFTEGFAEGVEKGRYLQKKESAPLMKEAGLSDEEIIRYLDLTSDEAETFLNEPEHPDEQKKF